MTRVPGPWLLSWRRFCRDRVGVASLLVVTLYLATVLLSGAGLIAGGWHREVGVSYAPPFFAGADAPAGAAAGAGAGRAAEPDDTGIVDPLREEIAGLQRGLAGTVAHARESTLTFGADKWGRDVMQKAIKGTETSFIVGLVAALLATGIGTVCGAIAGYHGGRMDDFFNWVYSVFTAIPYLLLILAIAAVLNQKGTLTVILILGFTGWTGIFRLVRAEYMKHRVREYVQAARAIGATDTRRMFVHILPNVGHVILVQLSLHVVLFMKSEVVLSFLGFGVGLDNVSWGSMLAEAQSELVLGKWWQLAAATAAMAVLVTAFSLFTDALRDALDPTLA